MLLRFDFIIFAFNCVEWFFVYVRAFGAKSIAEYDHRRNYDNQW